MTLPIITSAKLLEVADLYPGAPDWKAAMLYAADEIDRLTAALAAGVRCPCLIADAPCQPHCSCREPLYSNGCFCCTSYGSDEQKKAAAETIVARANAALADPEYVRVRREDAKELECLAIAEATMEERAAQRIPRIHWACPDGNNSIV